MVVWGERVMRAKAALTAVGFLALTGFAAGAAEAGTAAMIEEISAPTAGLEPMSQLNPGQFFMLKPGVQLVLTYTASCVRETITGGVVVIGSGESTVSGGTVVRTKAECDGGKPLLTANQAATSAAALFRSVNLKLGSP
jgi:hypothetical protein